MPASLYRGGLVAQLLATERTVKLLLLNDLGFNLGFYMLVPYLAGYLHSMAMPAWAIGLILGLRNLSQQGLFLVGGSIADRSDYKSVIVAGCVLRCAAFTLFGLAEHVASLLVASVLTGMAAALFTPALKAYLSVASRDDRPRAFALSAVLSQAGALLGPLLGMLLLLTSFRALAFAAGAVFLVWAVLLQIYLPSQRGTESGSGRSVAQDWKQALSNRTFVAFSVAMAGYAVLFSQLYLALPLALGRATGSQAPVGVAFMLSALMVIALQVRVTAAAEARWQPPVAIAAGLALMGGAFAPLALVAAAGADTGPWAAVAVLGTTAILTMGMMLAFPFTMNMIPVLAGERRLGVYYGVFYLAAGIGGAASNIAVGHVFEASGQKLGPAAWLSLTAVGLAAAAAITALGRQRVLPAVPVPASGGRS